MWKYARINRDVVNLGIRHTRDVSHYLRYCTFSIVFCSIHCYSAQIILNLQVRFFLMTWIGGRPRDQEEGLRDLELRFGSDFMLKKVYDMVSSFPLQVSLQG